MLPSNVFNTAKSDYTDGPVSLFIGQDPGLFDTVNRRHPEIWKLYKTMKSLDWDELEFDFTSCNVEFKTRPQGMAKTMIATLAWQWEGDSVAARMLLPVMAPFITSPELQAAYGRVTDNEVLHAATYSEMVRNSFDNPNEVLNEVLSVKEAMLRLKGITKIMSDSYRISHELALGMRRRDEQSTYDAAFKLVVAGLILERIQFMASFAVTFAIGEVGAFMPIAKSVQKIAQDELEIHVELGKAVLRNELQTEWGKRAFEGNLQELTDVLEEVVDSELAWCDFLYKDGSHLPGVTVKSLKGWVMQCARDVYNFLGIPMPSKYNPPAELALPFMKEWMNISLTQASPQEQQNGQYKVNTTRRDDEGVVFADDF